MARCCMNKECPSWKKGEGQNCSKGMTTEEKVNCPERKAYVAGNHSRWVEKNRDRIKEHQRKWQKKVGWSDYMKKYNKKRQKVIAPVTPIIQESTVESLEPVTEETANV